MTAVEDLGNAGFPAAANILHIALHRLKLCFPVQMLLGDTVYTAAHGLIDRKLVRADRAVLADIV